MKESRELEFKESISNTFLKTVSAFANYQTGTILFGVKDDGTHIGVDNPEKICLDIENKINDSIDPSPDYRIHVGKKDVIVLEVYEGVNKPYYYKTKAYRRNDTATVEVDRLELNRLILEGENKCFEELRSSKQDLQFNHLEKKFKEVVLIEELSKDILKTLNLYNDKEGFLIAGELLADANTFKGIDIARFGENINIILDRETYDYISILEQYEKAIDLYRKYYKYEKIEGAYRKTIENVPEEAFREAVANALVHRTWDVKANIRILMFDDRIEIISVGGLPKNISEREFLKAQLSILRNPAIANVFFRLDIIEKFGTGISRINECYKNSEVKPKFQPFENSIKVVLPVYNTQIALSDDEKAVYNAIRNRELSSTEIMKITGFGKSKVLGLLKILKDEDCVEFIGRGRGTRYLAKKQM